LLVSTNKNAKRGGNEIEAVSEKTDKKKRKTINQEKGA